MRNVRNIAFATALLFTGAIASFAQTADELVSKHLAATGGVDNWKKVTTVKMVGTMNGGGVEMPFTMSYIHNKAMKAEYSFGGMTGYEIVTDKAGWNYQPGGAQTKAEPMTAEQLKQSKDDLDFMPLVDYKKKGIKLTYLGKDDVEGTECQKMKLVFASGREETWFFDGSYNHIRTVEKQTADGKEQESVQSFSNFKKLPEGVTMSMTWDMDGAKVAFSTIEINKKIDESVFKPSN